MNKEFLPKDDFHPLQLTSADIILRQQLENSISSYFLMLAIALFKTYYLVVVGTFLVMRIL